MPTKHWVIILAVAIALAIGDAEQAREAARRLSDVVTVPATAVQKLSNQDTGEIVYAINLKHAQGLSRPSPLPQYLGAAALTVALVCVLIKARRERKSAPQQS
jgi:hypothetical protein